MGWLKWASNLACNPGDLIDFGTWWSATPETWENISHIVKNVALNSYTSSPYFISITTTSKPWIAGTEAHVSMSFEDCSLKTTKIRIQSFVLTILLSLACEHSLTQYHTQDILHLNEKDWSSSRYTIRSEWTALQPAPADQPLLEFWCQLNPM